MDICLSAECGSDISLAKLFAQHFEGVVAWTLSNGRQCQCRADLFQDIDENWWCWVCPNNISEIGIESPESAYLMTELGILFCQQLRTAPAFRYALAGVEVDEFRTYSELLEHASELIEPGSRNPFPYRRSPASCQREGDEKSDRDDNVPSVTRAVKFSITPRRG